MQPSERRSFLSILNTMSEYFSDPMTELRQQVYWDACHQAHVTLDEWAEVCTWAMQATTFQKVPLFAILMDHISSEREERRQRAKTSERSKQMQLAEAESVATGLTAAEAKEAINTIVAMLEKKMGMQRDIKRLSDYYPTTGAPDELLYTGMSEAEYQQRRTTLLAQMKTLPGEASLSEERHVRHVYERIRYEQQRQKIVPIRLAQPPDNDDDPLAI